MLTFSHSIPAGTFTICASCWNRNSFSCFPYCPEDLFGTSPFCYSSSLMEINHLQILMNAICDLLEFLCPTFDHLEFHWFLDSWLSNQKNKLYYAQWQGWSYVGDRLLSAVIPYEESGWYDGQMWVKPPEVRYILIKSYIYIYMHIYAD